MDINNKIKDRIISISIYTIKVLFLFSILFFTIIKPTALVYLLFLSRVLYWFLYLLVLFIISKIPKNKNSTKNFFTKHIVQPILLIIGVGFMFLLLYGIWYVGKLNETAYINRIIKEADEIVFYEDSTYYIDGIKGTKFTKNVILIDYDTKKVAFLFDNNIKQFQLNNTNEINNKNIQIKANLKHPAKSLTTFYPDENNMHRTSAIQLTMDNGTTYSISDLKEKDTGYYYYLGLK